MQIDSRRALREFHYDPRPLGEDRGTRFRPLALSGGRESSPAPASKADEPLQLAPFQLLLEAARERLEPARSAFHESLAGLAAAGRRRVGQGGEEPVESDAMGQLGALFVDPDRLAEVTRPRPTPAAAQDEDLTAALAEIEAFLAAGTAPALTVTHDGAHGLEGIETLEHTHLLEQPSPARAAASAFDLQAAKLARVLRAAKRLRLELEGDYEAARHAPWLAQLDWQAMSRDELALLTPVVAILTADQAAGAEMAALSRLLLSGRPVQIVVLVDPAVSPGAGDEAFAGFRFETALLGLSHREVLVHQSSAELPDHLSQGFHRALEATHTTLHVLARPGSREVGKAEGRARAALMGRAHPLLHYDPEHGSSWAARLDLSANPDPAAAWPRFEIDLGEGPIERAFTFAEFALLEPTWAHHFHPVPDGFDAGELTPLAEWSHGDSATEAGLPFILATDVSGAFRRLVVSRPLALATLDRLEFWRTLQELAGLDPAPADQEADSAPAATPAEPDRPVTEDLDHLRREAAEEIVERLTRSLLDIDPTSLIATTGAGSAASSGTSTLAGVGSLGGDVDEVAAVLRQMVAPELLEREMEPPRDERITAMAAELLQAVKEPRPA